MFESPPVFELLLTIAIVCVGFAVKLTVEHRDLKEQNKDLLGFVKRIARKLNLNGGD